MAGPTVNQLDRVRILTTVNVDYMSSPPGEEVDPHGIWVVVANVKEDLMITRGKTVLLIPYRDVVKVGTYDLEKALQSDLRSIMYGKEQRDGQGGIVVPQPSDKQGPRPH